MNDTANHLLDSLIEESDIFTKARLIRTLHLEHDVPLHEIARVLSIKPSFVSHILRLNRLPELIVDGFYSGLISITHLFILARLKEQSVLMEAYEKVLAEGMNAAQTERMVREYLYGVKTDGEYLPESEKNKYKVKKKMGNATISLDVVQTRIRSVLTVEVKGSVKEANPILRKLFTKIDEWKREVGL